MCLGDRQQYRLSPLTYSFLLNGSAQFCGATQSVSGKQSDELRVFALSRVCVRVPPGMLHVRALGRARVHGAWEYRGDGDGCSIQPDHDDRHHFRAHREGL